MAKSKVDSSVTLIAPNSRVCGDVHFREQLFVNGRIEGNLFADPDTEAQVVLSEQGSVAGEIRVPNVVINGTVDGDVYASGKLELAAKARVTGNVYYKLIEMQLGAKVEGQLVHEEVPSSAPAATSVDATDAANDGDQESGLDGLHGSHENVA